MYGIILDLDQTLLDTAIAEKLRRSRSWSKVYDLIPEFKSFENLIEIIRELVNKGISTCIVTNSPRLYCSKVVDHWAIPVSNMICYHDTKRHKPDPEPFLLALNKMSLNEDSVISLGDKADDILASKNAGIDSILCTWGSDVKNIDTDPNYTIQYPYQLKIVIDNWILKRRNTKEKSLHSKYEIEMKRYEIKCDRSLLNSEEIDYLERYGAFMEHLIKGDQKPTTEDQKRFIKVFELEIISPKNDNELIWFKYQKACEWEKEGGKISWPIFYENQLSIAQNKNYDPQGPDEDFSGSREDWYRNRRRYDG